ncbi:MAG: hypothetical protein ABIW82_14115 [Dokdonella sp.]
MRMTRRCLALLATLCGSVCAYADEPQSLSAKVDGASFVSDDHSILLVPLPNTFTLKAATAGASSYPPPKTPIDHLSITCDAFTAGQTMKWVSKDFASNACFAHFEKGSANSGPSVDEYTIDKDNPDTLFEITAAHGKVIEGRFQFHMKNAAGKTLTIEDGHFVAQDRQL